ncbi:MAG: TRAP transporter small permease, partial [Hyphomicrobiales bacterium]|nr:TRAP transporter small permease [Hyphomicrobiales bacterium]
MRQNRPNIIPLFDRNFGPGFRVASSSLALLDRVIACAVELLAGALVALETLILFAGVVARYVLRAPLVWSDELAAILFLWLAMLGAVIAYRRAEHMWMSALIGKGGSRRRAFFEALALCVGLAFLAFVMKPAIEYAVEEAAVVTPALEIPTVWRAMALPVGIGLMLLAGLARLGKSASFSDLALSIALILGVSVGLKILGPSLSSLGNYKLILFFVLLAGGAVLAGIPIAFAFGISTFAFL